MKEMKAIMKEVMKEPSLESLLPQLSVLCYQKSQLVTSPCCAAVCQTFLNSAFVSLSELGWLHEGVMCGLHFPLLTGVCVRPPFPLLRTLCGQP